METCEVCGTSIAGKSGRGLPARYCGSACRQKAYRLRKALPAELTSVARWVNWKLVHRKDQPKPAKVPLRLNGNFASTMDAGSWSSFEQVSAQDDRIGFVLGDSFGCVDFDDVIVDGVLDPQVASWLKECPPTFMELSPSGTGLHVWGRLPEERGVNKMVNGVSVEVYSYGRYITVTRKPFRGSVPRLADLSGFKRLILR